MSGHIDLTAMYVAHDALRRELDQLAKVTAVGGDEPRRVLATAVGWELFKKVLHVHHTAEDEALWPAMREGLAGQTENLALLEAMELEHARIDPIIEAIDAAVVEPGPPSDRVGELVDALSTSLRGHLRHEETDALPLIDATVTVEQWQRFGQVNGRLVGSEAPRIIPWMLDGASPEAIAKLLAPLPEPARQTYHDQWQPAYAALDLWRATH